MDGCYNCQRIPWPRRKLVVRVAPRPYIPRLLQMELINELRLLTQLPGMHNSERHECHAEAAMKVACHAVSDG